MSKDALQKVARASVLPAGSVPPVASLDSGEIKIKITEVIPDGPVNENEPDGPRGERSYFTCVYPDGFERDHHAKGPEDLVEKIVNQLRGRYGCDAVKTIKVPALEKGAIIVMEV